MTSEPSTSDSEDDENALFKCRFCNAKEFPTKTLLEKHQWFFHEGAKSRKRKKCSKSIPKADNNTSKETNENVNVVEVFICLKYLIFWAL